MNKQIIKNILMAFTVQLAIFMLGLGTQAKAVGEIPSVSQQAKMDMDEAAKDLQEAERMFQSGSNGNGAQKTGQMNWSSAPKSTPKQPPQATARQSDPRMDALQGSPETGYAGTWTDPATGDIITSVIAPQPQVNTTQYPPIYVQPDIGGWGYTGNYDNEQNYTQWPVAPGSPGYPGNNGYQRPPSYPGRPNPHYQPMPAVPYPGYTPPPFGQFNPHYRPLMPGSRPPQANNPGGIFQPGQNAWPSEQPPKPQYPEFNIPGWKPFPPSSNHYGPLPPMGNAGSPQYPEFNIPGWKPFPPSSNHYGPLPPNGGMPGQMRPNGMMRPRGGF